MTRPTVTSWSTWDKYRLARRRGWAGTCLQLPLFGQEASIPCRNTPPGALRAITFYRVTVTSIPFENTDAQNV